MVTFGQGETHNTIALPILNDGKPDGNETVNLTLDKISSTRGTRYPAHLVFTIVDREDVTPPTVQDRRLITRGQAVTGIVLTFSEPMDPATVQNPGNYFLSRTTTSLPGRSHRLLELPGTRLPPSSLRFTTLRRCR